MYLAVCLLDYLSDRQSSSHSADEPFLFSCCSESGKLSVRIRWQQDFMIMVMRLIVNADKHSPALSARSTKRRVRGMLMSVGVESSHWQIAKRLRSWASSEADCECTLYKVEADVIAAKKRYDHATAVLKELLDKRDTIRKDEILSAIVKSGRSYEEIMNFLNVEETERETKE